MAPAVSKYKYQTNKQDAQLIYDVQNATRFADERFSPKSLDLFDGWASLLSVRCRPTLRPPLR